MEIKIGDCFNILHELYAMHYDQEKEISVKIIRIYEIDGKTRIKAERIIMRGMSWGVYDYSIEGFKKSIIKELTHV